MFTKQHIEKYFFAEKQLGLAFIIIGAIAVILAIAFLFLLKTDFYRGVAIPLALVGLIQLIAGTKLFVSSDKDRIRNVYAYDMNPGQLKHEELPRVKALIKNYAIIKWLEMALVVTGLALLFYSQSRPEKAFWYGLGISLSIMALITLVADTAAERRAVEYAKGLESYGGRK